MHFDLPAQSIAAIATLVAALIASALSFVNLTLTKEQKTSEFRQAWIDGLRQDLSSFFAGTRAFARATETLHFFGADYKEKAALLMSDEKISNIRYQTAETHYRIKLRLNPDEVEHKELLRLMTRAIAEQNIMLTEKTDVKKTLIAIELAAEYARPVLKKEWRRVKKGELPFRIARDWPAPIIAVLSLAFVIFLLMARSRFNSSVKLSSLQELSFPPQPAQHMPLRQIGMLVQHQRRHLPRPHQQIGIGLQIGKAQHRRP